MKGYIISIVHIFLFALLVTSVQADYSISGPENIFVESCTYTTYTLQVTNSGSSIIKPTIALEEGKKANNWVVLDPRSPFIEPGTTEQINVFLRAPCKTEGNFDLNIIVTDVPNPSVLEQKIQVTRNPNIAINAPFFATSACPCQPQKITFSVTNPASYPDTYTFTPTGKGAQYITVAPAQDILFAGQTAEVTAYFAAPCEVYGDIDFAVEVNSRAAGYTAKVPLQAQVQQCYDYSISAPETIRACIDGDTVVQMGITNDMYFPNSYELSSKPAWTNFDGKQIELWPNQSGQLELILSPRSGSLGQQPGLHNVQVQAISTKGDVKVNLDLPVQLNACYDIALEVEEEYTVCPGENIIPVKVVNYGVTDEFITLGITKGPEFIELSPAFINVSSLTFQEVNLTANVDDITRGTYKVELRAELNNNILIWDEAKLALTAIDNTACYQVTFEPNEYSLFPGEQVHVLNITNDGVRQATYNLALNGTQWMRLDQGQVNLAPGQSQAITITTTAPEDVRGVFPAALVAATNKIAYATTIDFKTPLNSFRIWLVIIIIILLIILLLLLLFLIKRKKKTKKKKVSKKTKADKKQAKAQKKAKQEEDETKYDEVFRNRSKSNSWWWLLLLLFLLLILLLPLFFGQQNRTTDLTQVEDPSNVENYLVENPNRVLINFTQTVDLSNYVDNINDFIQVDRAYAGVDTDSVPELQVPAIITFYNLQLEDPVITENADECTTCEIYYNDGNTLVVYTPQFNKWYKAEERTTQQASEETPEQPVIPEEEPTIIVPNELSQRQGDILRVQELLKGVPAELRDSIAYQIIDENSQVEVNLKELFNDPDNEELFFTSFAVPNMSVTIVDGIATITPDENFIGIRYTVFFARDQEGATAQTPVINILVVPTNLTQEAQAIRDSLEGVQTIEKTFEEQYPELREEDKLAQAITLTVIMIIILITFVGAAYGISSRRR